MTNKHYIFLGIIGIIIVCVIGYFISNKSDNTRIVGSLDTENGYYSTTTGSFATASSTIIRNGSGVLGTVVIGVTSATTFDIMDANSPSDSASTTLLSVSASPAIGSSMVLDINFKRGLYFNFPASFAGRYSVTYK